MESVVGAAADTVAAPELSAQSVPDPGPVQTSHRPHRLARCLQTCARDMWHVVTWPHQWHVMTSLSAIAALYIWNKEVARAKYKRVENSNSRAAAASGQLRAARSRFSKFWNKFTESQQPDWQHNSAQLGLGRAAAARKVIWSYFVSWLQEVRKKFIWKTWRDCWFLLVSAGLVCCIPQVTRSILIHKIQLIHQIQIEDRRNSAREVWRSKICK